jgi:DNA-directed RNA polymerase subunit M/transcription elongation factor TFIIS
MNFCPQCRNMYYTKLDDDELKYYCRNCGHTDDKMDATRICEVFHTQLKRSETYTHVVNEFTVYDPTLPRVLNMKCPSCVVPDGDTTAAQAKKEIICVRYDDKFMKYVYICTHCNTSWKT